MSNFPHSPIEQTSPHEGAHSHASAATLRIGIDVGGTFTDLIAASTQDGKLTHHKTPSTPRDPSVAIATGICALLRSVSQPAHAVRYIGHGTTVATNMIIEGTGAHTALLTTRGFRDVLEIARQTRPHLYNYRIARAPPVVRRRDRHEVSERLDSAGNVLEALHLDDIDNIAEQLRTDQIEAIAVCFLHSYRDGKHEALAVQRLRALLPDLYISASHEILPEFREFERTSTTALNAYVGPRMRDYSRRLTEQLDAIGITTPSYTMQSNGGLMSPAQVQDLPVRTCLSGPAAGVVSAAHTARAAAAIGTIKTPDLLTFDVGGTSTDVSLVRAGQASTTVEREVAGYPVRTPMVDVHVIGAGGGSIAYIDRAGALKVGPHSAGADPGPVAYAAGGQQVTLTDANVVLGRLSEQTLLAGFMPLDQQRAQAALDAQIARPLDLSRTAAALGIIEIAVAHIARAIRGVTAAHGLDPTTLPLLAYGGAGPLHAVAVAREVQAPSVLIPPEPGTMCARGLLLTDLSRDFVSSVVRPASSEIWNQVQATFATLSRRGTRWLDDENVSSEARELRFVIDTRYAGQSFEIPVPLAQPGSVSVDNFIDAFHTAHAAMYGYAIRTRAAIIVNCRLEARARVATDMRAAARAEQSIAAEPLGVRQVYLDNHRGWQECPVYARATLAPGMQIQGPAVIEEMSATTLLDGDLRAQVDALHNLVVQLPAN